MKRGRTHQVRSPRNRHRRGKSAVSADCQHPSQADRCRLNRVAPYIRQQQQEHRGLAVGNPKRAARSSRKINCLDQAEQRPSARLRRSSHTTKAVMASDGTNMLSGRSRPRQSMVHAMQPPRTTAPPRPGQGAKDGDATEFMRPGLASRLCRPMPRRNPVSSPRKKRRPTGRRWRLRTTADLRRSGPTGSS